MTKSSTRFAFYAILSLKALMGYDAPVAPASAGVVASVTGSAATARIALPSAATDALAVKSRDGATEYQGPRFGLGSQAAVMRVVRHA